MPANNDLHRIINTYLDNYRYNPRLREVICRDQTQIIQTEEEEIIKHRILAIKRRGSRYKGYIIFIILFLAIFKGSLYFFSSPWTKYVLTPANMVLDLIMAILIFSQPLFFSIARIASRRNNDLGFLDLFRLDIYGLHILRYYPLLANIAAFFRIVYKYLFIPVYETMVGAYYIKTVKPTLMHDVFLDISYKTFSNPIYYFGQILGNEILIFSLILLVIGFYNKKFFKAREVINKLGFFDNIVNEEVRKDLRYALNAQIIFLYMIPYYYLVVGNFLSIYLGKTLGGYLIIAGLLTVLLLSLIFAYFPRYSLDRMIQDLIGQDSTIYYHLWCRDKEPEFVSFTYYFLYIIS